MDQYLEAGIMIGPARTTGDLNSRPGVKPRGAGVGMLNEVVTDVETLQRRADETRKCRRHAPITIEVTKEAVRRIRRTLTRDEARIDCAATERGFREAWTPSSHKAHNRTLDGQIERIDRAGTHRGACHGRASRDPLALPPE